MTRARGYGSDEGRTAEFLERLWSTPVGRRWVFKAGLGSLVAGLTWRPAVAGAVARPPGKRTASVAFQFALRQLEGVSGLELIANGQRMDLRAHTARSRSELRARGGLWKVMDVGALSHFVEGVRLPMQRTSLVRVEGRRGKRAVMACEVWHAPEHATIKLAEASERLTGTFDSVSVAAQRLQALGLDPGDLRTASALARLEMVGDSYQTATALTMTHPNVATIDPEAAATTKALLGQTAAVTTLGSYIGQMQRSGRDFATLELAVDSDGSPSEIELDGEPVTFSTIRLNESDVRFRRNLRGAVHAGISGVRDDPDLGAVIDRPLDEEPGASRKTWIQPEGVVAKPEPYGDHLRAQAGVEAKVKNPGSLFGTKTVLRGGVSDRKVPVKLYNNFVRWVWVYVQYLGADGQNLSADLNATFPDTKYSKTVCILPQVFTVFGVPLWDSNTVEFTLEFPEEAHTARLLYCGLGADATGGGWRQYFPSDAYRGKIAPEDEVLFAALTTGLMTIGLNAFALAADINVIAAWKATRKYFTSTFEVMQRIGPLVDKVTRASLKFTAAESLAVAVVSGGALYLDIEHAGENVHNLWNLILGMATVIPKVLFNPGTLKALSVVGAELLFVAGSSAVTDALPFVGQYLAVWSLAGDEASLVEVGLETGISPWVIENEISLTYAVTVTVARDARSSTFPATARSWRLETLVDGGLGLPAVTGSVNVGGRLRADPLVLEVTAPFAGKTIQWSIVFLDEEGMQVGTGVSEQFPNDDPANPPSVVSIVIEQIPAVISDRTVFKRSATTTYDPAVGGYSWSDQVAVGGTLSSGGALDVAGAAVATLAGVAGFVWKQRDRYYLRGVPLAQDGRTVELGVGSHEGWARRPFLLLDSFVAAQDEGNHVLVEPDANASGYHVRKVSLDRVSGAVSWDPGQSYGMFGLPVSACALHSSGRVVAVNTDSGRLGWLDPVDTARPQLAAYVAGPGEQVGLLSSPVAVAVTNPGVVIVLEAAARQLSAFDLNGNPVRYFGPGPEHEFTVGLVSDGTYLDVAVDGASQIYALYFTGAGANPGDYRIDVYGERGDPMATHGPGTNLPHLAVDYWRSVYGANYSPLTKLGTDQPHIDPRLGVPEPSLSRFEPARAK
jgi:hypothetical protein